MGIALWDTAVRNIFQSNETIQVYVYSRVAVVSSWLKLLLLQNARLFYIMSREEPGIRRITIYMCRSGEYNTLC